MPRHPSIDILRGLAIALMVVVHFADNLSARGESSSRLYDALAWLGALPAPLFTFLAGVSFHHWIRKQKAAGMKERAITRIAWRRGLFLFAVGLAFNFCLWLPEETFNWDVLTLLGTALVLLASARHLPRSALALIGLSILLLSPPMRIIADYPAYWENETFTYDNTPRDVIFGFVANGYFPIFPWLIFPLAGYLVGGANWSGRTLSASGFGLIAMAWIGVAGGEFYPGLFTRYYADGYSEFPASTAFAVGMLGVCFLSLALARRGFDRRRLGWCSRQLQRFSAFSLTIYVVHHAVHLWPLWLYGAWMGQPEITQYWRNAMGTPLAVGLAVVFLTLCAFALPRLERRKNCCLESLMRRVCG